MGSNNEQSAVAVPTKQFFVSMLTRDISLADAILDLVDNCLDGALRLAKGGAVDYSNYSVDIKLDQDSFVILDNCGGIPREVARNYAFKMGREPDDDRDSEDETIGMYGIGMKRAIFKMGREARVATSFEGDTFEVPITSEWLDEKGWEPLPILENKSASEQLDSGTQIKIFDLYKSASRHFMNDAFINELRTAIAEHFTTFLQRGLSISVNNKSIEAVKVEVLVSKRDDGPTPFVFEKVIDGVTVSITVGLNTGRGFSPDDDGSPDFERDRSASTAGWTVFCNDRAVIVGDKSRLTGWGDGIPLYHYQFSILTGIVEFRSNHAEQLPITTTKRALDTSSDVWLQALVKMKEGMRVWISYTNAWKNHPRSDQTEHWVDAQPLSIRKTVEAVSKRENAVKANGSVEFNPQKKKVMPMPAAKTPSSRRVVYSRPTEEIEMLSREFFDTDKTNPGIVGERCFELVLKSVVNSEGSS